MYIYIIFYQKFQMIAGANLFGKEASGRNLVKLEFCFGILDPNLVGEIYIYIYIFEILESKLGTL